MPNLQSVSNVVAAPEPPYPADTRVNGWRFEIDYERVKRSDTWVLAEPEMRPWLLMTWLVSFDQQPAGSLPNDHKIIAKHIGMDERLFRAHADVLLRGFTIYSDGRLYHPVVVDRVLYLINYREKERLRKADYRSRSRGSPMGQTRTSGGVPTQEQEQEQEEDTSPKGEESSAKAERPSPCPHEKIKSLYHRMLPQLPTIRVWDSEDQRSIRPLWKQNPDLEWWKGYFEHVSNTPFLLGDNGRQWKADLRWLVKPSNFKKVFEGKYNRG